MGLNPDYLWKRNVPAAVHIWQCLVFTGIWRKGRRSGDFPGEFAAAALRCAADGPPSSWLRAPVGRPLRRNARLPVTRAEPALPSQTCSISQSSRGSRRRVNHSGSGSNRDGGRQRQTAAGRSDRSRSRMPAKGGGRMVSYPSKGDNVGVSHWVLVCLKVSEFLCRLALTGTCLSGACAVGDVISELRSPAVRRRPAGQSPEGRYTCWVWGGPIRTGFCFKDGLWLVFVEGTRQVTQVCHNSSVEGRVWGCNPGGGVDWVDGSFSSKIKRTLQVINKRQKQRERGKRWMQRRAVVFPRLRLTCSGI